MSVRTTTTFALLLQCVAITAHAQQDPTPSPVLRIEPLAEPTVAPTEPVSEEVRRAQAATEASERGHAALARGWPGTAVQQFSTAIELEPDCAAHYVGLGRGYVLLGGAEGAARAAFVRALELSPDDAQARAALGSLPPPSQLAPQQPAREPPNAALIYGLSVLTTGTIGALAFGLLVGRSCLEPDGSNCGLGTTLAAMTGFAGGALVGVGLGAVIYAVMSASPERTTTRPVRVGLKADADGAGLQLHGKF